MSRDFLALMSRDLAVFARFVVMSRDFCKAMIDTDICDVERLLAKGVGFAFSSGCHAFRRWAVE